MDTIYRNLKKMVFLFYLLLFLIGTPLNAKAGTWASVGPPGENITSISVSPNFLSDQTIFAGTSYGSYSLKSVDGGSTWSEVFGYTAVWSLAISPNYAVDQTIYAGTDGGVYKSVDGGVSWSNVNGVWGILNVHSLAISPNYASDQTIFAGTSSGFVFMSTNGGGSWSWWLNTGHDIRSFAMSPNYASDKTIFAGTSGGGVYMSTDGGLGWMPRSGWLGNLDVRSLAISPNYASDWTIFAGTYGGGVYRSTDRGGSWGPLNYGLSNQYVQSLAISPTYTTDHVIFAGTYGGGVFKSTTVYGWEWLDVNTGLSDLNVQSLSLSPDYQLFAGTSGSSVWRYVDFGPDLVMTVISGPTDTVTGGSYWVSFRVENQGDDVSDAFTIAYHLSTNAIYGDVDDVNFGTTPISVLSEGSGVQGGGNLTVPANIPNGQYYLCAMADSGNGVIESDEANNALCFSSQISIGGGIRINQSATGNQQTQTVAWNDADNEYLSLWQDFRSGSANPDIYSARIDKNGNVVAGDLPIVTQTAKQAGPWVSYGGGGYVAVWIDQRNMSTTGTDVYGAWILPDGTVSSEFIITNATANQRAASVFHNPSANNFLVTWTDDSSGTSDVNIWGAVVNPGGGVGSGPFAMVTATGNQRGPYVRYDYGNSNYFMVWFDNRGGNNDVYGSRVNSSGGLLDGSGLVISNASGNQNNPRITDRDPYSGISNFVLSWIDLRNGQADIYGAVIDEFGTKLGSDIQIAGGSYDQRASSIDVDYIRTGQAVVSWIDKRNGTDYDIYRAQVDQSGVVSGETLMVGAGTGAANNQQGPLVTYSEDSGTDNGFLFLWRDNRSWVDYDIYGIKVWP